MRLCMNNGEANEAQLAEFVVGDGGGVDVRDGWFTNANDDCITTGPVVEAVVQMSVQKV